MTTLVDNVPRQDIGRNPMGGRKVHKVNHTLFVALPVDARRPIEGGCSCAYCKDHPDRTPTWDVLALPAKGDGWMIGRTWIVHYPVIASREN